ncbi:MAG: NAD-dependent DNA ligase [Faunusvirus sp.]|jgi:DNA ligase (NAD+)|uniref:DNA ligase (NAD(+)) n=1 Tax=Faunusvirus sp. TaxID=2487766 RepID=A0A3G4ZWZ4_9VIRU|nr:MAG: NAD-dependent DNA ligase [Faunusvirus sp.]
MNILIAKINKSPTETIKKLTIAKLIEVIKYTADKYYNSDESVVSDAVYDMLIDSLKERDPANAALTAVGASIQSKNKVTLPYYMGSMDKITPERHNFTKWCDEFKGSYVLSDKLDGISALLIMHNHKMKLYTRGDGSEGQNITAILPYINIYKRSVRVEMPNKCAIRGELIMSIKNFEKYKTTKKNPRNTVSGLVNSKTLDTTMLGEVDLVCYEVIHPVMKISDQLLQLEMWGLHTVHYDIYKTVTIDDLKKYLERRKKHSAYEIDGVIVADDHLHRRIKSGNPKYALAFKFNNLDLGAIVTVKEVEWRVSKDGYIKPVVIFDPVTINGVEISRATAYNAKYVLENSIGPGAVLKIIRSGDVIPKIIEIVKRSKKIEMPSISHKWNKSGVDLVYDDSKQDVAVEKSILVKNITFFFKKLGVKHVDGAIVRKIIEAGYDTVQKIISASENDLLKVENFSNTMAHKVYTNIQTSIKNVDIVRLVAASNVFGHGLAEKKLKLIFQEHSDILDRKISKIEMIELISKIKGFDTITATKFAENIDKFKKFLKLLKGVNVVYPIHAAHNKSGIFCGQIIVFTGFRNKEWEAAIQHEGGIISTSVSKNTTLVVTNDIGSTSGKVAKARELGITIIDLDTFAKKYKLT